MKTQTIAIPPTTAPESPHTFPVPTYSCKGAIWKLSRNLQRQPDQVAVTTSFPATCANPRSIPQVYRDLQVLLDAPNVTTRVLGGISWRGRGARHPDDRRAYRGKQDLAVLPPALATFLSDLQNCDRLKPQASATEIGYGGRSGPMTFGL